MPKVKANKKRKRFSDANIHQCGKFYRHLSCNKDAEHKFFKRIYCGYAGCPTCRKGDWKAGQVSEAVRRRVMNTWDKVMYGRAMGQFVLTFPESIQEKFYDKEEFNILFHEASQFVMDMTGIKGNMVFLHPVGNKGKGFHPHLEVLFPYEDAEWQDPYGDKDYRVVQSLWLSQLSNYWTRCLAKLYPAAMANHKGQIQCHYDFADKPGRMVHRVRYAADFHWASNYEEWTAEAKNYLMSLRGTRTIRGFGFLSDRKWKAHVQARVVYWQFDLSNSEQDEFGGIIDDGSKCFLCDGILRAIRYSIDGKLVWSVPDSCIRWSQLIAIGQGLFCDLLLGLKHLKKRISSEVLLEDYTDELALAG